MPPTATTCHSVRPSVCLSVSLLSSGMFFLLMCPFFVAPFLGLGIESRDWPRRGVRGGKGRGAGLPIRTVLVKHQQESAFLVFVLSFFFFFSTTATAIRPLLLFLTLKFLFHELFCFLLEFRIASASVQCNQIWLLSIEILFVRRLKPTDAFHRDLENR